MLLFFLSFFSIHSIKLLAVRKAKAIEKKMSFTASLMLKTKLTNLLDNGWKSLGFMPLKARTDIYFCGFRCKEYPEGVGLGTLMETVVLKSINC